MQSDFKLNDKDIMNSCRTCLDILSENKMHDIFDSCNLVDIPEILYSCASIRIIEHEELMPKSICDSCYNSLIKFNDFKVKAQLVDEKLQLYKTQSFLKGPETPIFDSLSDIKHEDIYNEYESELLCQDMVVTDYKCEGTSTTELTSNIELPIKSEHSCELCNTVFDSQLKLLTHEKKYSHKKSCCKCNKIFKFKKKYLKHIAEHSNKIVHKDTSNTGAYKCNICNESYNKINSLSAHMKKHRHMKELTCSICSKTFKKSYHLSRHKQIHFNNTIASLKLNSKEGIIKEESNNADNQDISDLTQVYECKQCLAAFRKPHSLSAHMKIHIDGTKSLTCSVCFKTFKKRYHLTRHEMIHVKNYNCTFCPKSFLERSEWREHVKGHAEYAPISCPVCSKLLSHHESLNRHMKVHTRERGCLCPHCGKTFENVSNLRQHIKRHMGEKDFSCILCPEKFISRGELKHHMVVHTQERAFSCNQCGLKFTRKGSLKMHKLKHQDHRPFKCDSCPMGFPTKYMLQRHTRIHTGEKPFPCDSCPRTFAQSGELLKHRRSHLGDNVHRCPECNEGFRYKVELRKHISEHYVTDKTNSVDEELPNNVDENIQQ